MKKTKIINIENLTEEQLLLLQKDLSSKSKELLEKTRKKLNSFYKPYGLEVILAFQAVKDGEANLILEKAKSEKR